MILGIWDSGNHPFIYLLSVSVFYIGRMNPRGLGAIDS
jgi:hypothetical protein